MRRIDNGQFSPASDKLEYSRRHWYMRFDASCVNSINYIQEEARISLKMALPSTNSYKALYLCNF